MSAVMPTYGRIDLAFERGEGPYLFDADDRRYLDFATGIAVNTLGHSHPRLVAALTEQAGKLWHCSNLYNIAGQTRLAERLCAESFADKVFFCNSGAEAMEGVIKTARRYHFAKGSPERFRTICFEGAFHGRTIATIAAGGNAKALEGFGPPADGFDHVSFGNANEVRATIRPETGAILVEPIQGESGIRPPGAEFLAELRAIADEFGLLLLFDEVQTGIGHTGKLFGYQWHGVAPDVMGLAKGLGGGFPIGAVLATDEACQGMVPGTHGSTFGGNPLAAAAANTVLDVVLEDGFLDHVIAMGDSLHAAVGQVAADHPKVLESVRGRNLLVGIKCVVPNMNVVAAMRDRNVLLVPAGENIARMLPPLNIEQSHIDEAVSALADACAALEP
ncbi:MAG: aspartate aminotransferase family protein [Alphaproteobacteria bacterium]